MSSDTVKDCVLLDEWSHCKICQKLIKTVDGANGKKREHLLTEEDLRCSFYTNCPYKQLSHNDKEVMFTKVNRKSGSFDPIVIGYSNKHQSNWLGAVKQHLDNWDNLLTFMLDSECLEATAVVISYMNHECPYDDVHLYTEWNIPTEDFSSIIKDKNKKVHFDRYIKQYEIEITSS